MKSNSTCRSLYSIFFLTMTLGMLFSASSLASEPLSKPLSKAPPLNFDKIAQLSKDPDWLRLLHFKPNWPLGKQRSLVDGPEFFFSPTGKSDPHSEMIETIQAFSQDRQVGRLKQHPQCAFPERFRFLKKELQLQIKEVPCPLLEEFLARFKAKSVSMVFSSAYPNNPGSMFGHTFLMVRSQARPEILDYGISYAAVVGNDENGLAFMLFGLMGGYKGQFSMIPYYTKINEYNNSESRDLWEYDLSLTQEETLRLLRHLWEIETTSWFDYYFFDENCGYQLMAALEVAKPEWSLTHFQFFVIPGETIKELTAIPGAVTNVKFRPSLRKKLYQKLDFLNSQQKDEFYNLIHEKTEPTLVQDTSVQDTAIAYLQYQKQKEGNKLNEKQAQLMRKLLLQRSQSKSGSEQQSFPLPPIREDTRPELGHHPSRVGTSFGLLEGNEFGKKSAYFQELTFKVAYHDLMNNDLGYSPFSHIDFPSLTLRYIPSSSQFYVENLTAFSITSLFPLSFLEKRFSWKLLLDYYSPKDFGCISCHALHFEGGGGATVNLFTPKAIAYALLTGNFETGSTFNKAYRFGPKFQLATLVNPIQAYKILLSGNMVTDLWQSDRQSLYYFLNLDHSYSINQAFDIRLGLISYFNSQSETFEPYKELKFSLNYYF